jgi:hypothetical protein
MGEVVRSMDWSKNPLGPLHSWPPALRTTVSLCLASNFPISLAWGPNHIQIYNDGYWPICGGKHPDSMGQDFTVCWESPWPVIGDSFERALRGETSYLEDQRMFLDRNGYPEETFFTFSFSPIRDESGEVAGLFHPVTETTPKMVSQRRTRTLRGLAARAGKAAGCTGALARGHRHRPRPRPRARGDARRVGARREPAGAGHDLHRLAQDRQRAPPGRADRRRS